MRFRKNWPTYIRFSLSALLIAATIVILSTSFLAGYYRRFRVEQAAIERIEKHVQKLDVGYDYDFPDGFAKELAVFRGEPKTPAFVQRIFGKNLFSTVCAIRVEGWSDECADAISRLRSLKQLRIDNTYSLTNPASLGDLNQLECLTLDGVSLNSIRNLESSSVQKIFIRSLTGLQSLNGIERMQSLTELRLVGLSSQVDLSAIAQLPNLEQLLIGGGSYQGQPNLKSLASSTAHTLELNQLQGLTSLDGLGGLPHLKELKLLRCNDLVDIAALKQLPQLRRLSSRYCDSVSPGAYATLDKIGSLHISSDKQQNWRKLEGMKALESLSFTCRYYLGDLSWITRLPNLKELHLRGGDESNVESARDLAGIASAKFAFLKTETGTIELKRRQEPKSKTSDN